MVEQERQCNVHNDGVCAMHNVEVERRNQTDRKTDVLPAMQKNIAYIFGYAFLATLLIIGGFYYTSEIKAEAIARDSELRATMAVTNLRTEKKIEKVTDQVSILTTAMVQNEVKHDALLDKVDDMMDYMILLINTKHPEVFNSTEESK